MKPFDLEAAKRGEPIQTRDGREVFFIGVSPLHSAYRVAAHVAGNSTPDFYTLDGLLYEGDEHPGDISMKPRIQTLAVEIWRDKSGVYTSRVVYPNGYASNAFDYGEKVETISCVVAE